MQSILLSLGVILGFGMPICLIVWWNSKHNGSFRPFFTGVFCFVLFAMVLEQISHSLVLSQPAVTSSVEGYTLYAAFAAGIFEEAGRLFGFKVMLKKATDRSCAVAYGIGHGGAEMAIVFGINYLILLLAYSGIDIGGNMSVALVTGAISVTPATLAIGLFERISAMMIHIGLSMIMFTAVRQKGKFWLYPAAICLHALADVPAALYQCGVLKSIFLLEASAFAVGALCLYLGQRVLYGKDGRFDK